MNNIQIIKIKRGKISIYRLILDIYIKCDKSAKVSLFLLLSSMRQKGVGLMLRKSGGEVRAKRK